MTKMFSFITSTWNPVGGECKHGCSYCWAKQLIKRFNTQKYVGEARLYPLELYKRFKPTDFIFVSDMCDLFGEWVPKDVIQRVLDRISTSRATYLLLTKNPARYSEFDLPRNVVAGATIETNLDMNLGSAPSRMDRIEAMTSLNHPRKMVSIEPVMEFELEQFYLQLNKAKPEFVAVGYDNYNNGLTEPSLSKTIHLIHYFEANNVLVYKKTLREPTGGGKPETEFGVKKPCLASEIAPQSFIEAEERMNKESLFPKSSGTFLLTSYGESGVK